MFRMGGRAVVAATFFAAVSGSAMLAAADPAGMVLAQTADSSQERTRQDCIRNGGWYTEGGCEYESKAKAAAMARDKQACERDDFRPKPSRLCDYCAYKAYCPAWGGDPSLAQQLVAASA